MPWKKLLAWATGQIDEALRQKLEFVLAQMASPLGCQQMGFFPPTEGQTGTAIRLGPDRKVGGAICPRESRLGL
jgi:hypothetical protein